MNKTTTTAFRREQYAAADTDDVPVIKGAIVTADQNKRISEWLRKREGNSKHPWRRRVKS